MAVTQLALATGLLAVAGLLVVQPGEHLRLIWVSSVRPDCVRSSPEPERLSHLTNAASSSNRLDAELRAMPGGTSVTATTIPIPLP
jgi:hypothetical protein